MTRLIFLTKKKEGNKNWNKKKNIYIYKSSFRGQESRRAWLACGLVLKSRQKKYNNNNNNNNNNSSNSI